MRLIDADALTDEIRKAIRVSESPWNHYGWFQKTVDAAPTIEAGAAETRPEKRPGSIEA